MNNEVDLVPIYYVTKLSVAVDTYDYLVGRLLVLTSSVIKNNMKFVISTPKNPIESSHCDFLIGLDFSKCSVIDLTWNVNQ